jgi:hypothetical protein
MINILPIEDRKEIKKTYFKRLSIVSLIFFTSTIFMAILMLLPTIFFLNENEGISKSEVEYINKKLSDVGISQITPMIEGLNKKTQILTKINGFEKDSDTITEIIKAGDSGVIISSFSISKGVSAEKIFISGESVTRKDLIAFMDNLKKCKAGLKTKCIMFDKIESPVSNLLKEKDITFSINAEVASTIK